MKKFAEVIENLEENARVAILTHPGPDPDAMGSCLGMQWLLTKKWGVKSDIFMEGDYSSRRSNTAMVNVLGIDLRSIDVYLENHENYAMAIILDATPDRANEKIRDNIKVVIDHHNVMVDEDKFSYVDIRKVGACSTMVFDLMHYYECMPADAEDDRIVATAMLEGIRTDTDMYRRGDTTGNDFNASSLLFECANMDLINQIERCKLPRYHFDMRAEIVKEDNCEVVNGSTFIACVGCITQTRVDSLPILADEIINDMEGISTSIIFAMVDGSVELRMRSNEVSLDVNRFLKKHFNEYGGAKFGSGGAHIPIGLLSGTTAIPPELTDRANDLAKCFVMTILRKDVKSE